jgi:transposase
MVDMHEMLGRWQLDTREVRERMYRAPTPRERERWHALWLLARGWSASQVAEALERDAHTIGEWVEDFRQRGPAGLAFEQKGGPPPPSTQRNKLP